MQIYYQGTFAAKANKLGKNADDGII